MAARRPTGGLDGLMAFLNGMKNTPNQKNHVFYAYFGIHNQNNTKNNLNITFL